jgi:hypothetical protein
MNVEALSRQFARIGANLEVAERAFVRGRNGASEFSLDIREEGRKEFYLLEIAKPAIETVDFQVLNSRPDLRHLVLMARNEMESPGWNSRQQSAEIAVASTKEKFLCGHDERHWFVASLPAAAGVTDVTSAMESLKPREAVWSQRRRQVSAKDRNKRHNAGFIRQGEWFFVPVEWFRPSPLDIVRKDEPISRGAGSKPHMVSELVRRGGELVYVTRNGRNVLSAMQYEARVRSGKIKNAAEWIPQRMTTEVYVRGKVRHADHKTIVLKEWHRVAMNAEPVSNNVRFLD